MSSMLDLSAFPDEILIEVLLFAAYRNAEFARTLTLVSKWTYKLAQKARFSTISVIHIRELERFFHSLCLIREPFPVHLPTGELFRLSFKEIPELNPTKVPRERARLIHSLWLIPLGTQERNASLKDHIYMRLALQLCVNVRSLALTGPAFSHFLINKSGHFHDVTHLDGGSVENQQSPYPYLTHLTLFDSTPASIMERQYARAEEYVKIFKQLTHFTTYGSHYPKGLPIPIQHFTSLTHVALPLVLKGPAMPRDDILTTTEIYMRTGGWELLQSSRQIQMVVFLFPSNGQLSVGTFLSNLWLPHPPGDLIVGAHRLDSRAYAVPIDEIHVHRQWWEEVRGGQSIWDVAKDTLRRYHHGQQL